MKYIVIIPKLITGGFAYGALEVAWRGYTHISMIVLGGICFCILLRLAKRKSNLFVKSFFGTSIITSLELLTGCIVNLWLNLRVWDYSEEALHLWGQVCVRFFLLWWVLCAIIIPLCGMWQKGVRLSFARIRIQALELMR